MIPVVFLLYKVSKEEYAQCEELKKIASKSITKAQEYVRYRNDVSSVSLREIRRFSIFYNFFVEYLRKKKELLEQRKMQNRLEIPRNDDIEGLDEDDLNDKVEIYDIDMYNQYIKPLFEGTNVYKRFSEKAVKTEYEEYDPIKNKGILPEAYDYALRKLYANINLNQFEFFTIDGIPKKDNILPFNEIVGIRYSDNAKRIIKLKEENPQTGTKFDFIGKDLIPFSIMTKNNNWDIVCPEYASYLAIKTMIDSILSQPKQKNKLELPQKGEDIKSEKEEYQDYEE